MTGAAPGCVPPAGGQNASMMQLDGGPASADDLGGLALGNYGHFTTMRVLDGRVRGLRLHLDRLVTDCRTLFGVDLDPDRVRELARRAVPAGAADTVLRITVFDPALSPVSPAPDAHPRILVTVRPAPAGGPDPAVGVRLRSVRYRRELPTVKHTALFGAVYHRRAALRAGFDDVLFVDDDSTVTEGSTWNIAVVRDGRVSWPAGGCLPGVTMQLLSTQLRRQGVGVDTVRLRLAELSAAGSAFITNAAIGLRAVGAVDGVAVAAEPTVLRTLRAAYEAVAAEPL